jgi:hypothetical protein
MVDMPILKKSRSMVSNSEGGKHTDVVFTNEQIRQINLAKDRLNTTTISEVIRRAWRVFWFLMDNTKPDSVFIITDGPPMRDGEPMLPADNQTCRVTASILL